MPCFSLIQYRDTKRWLECVAQAGKAMIAEGWNKHARKFSAVQQRRAVKIYLYR